MMNFLCCYITMQPETRASEPVICLTPQMCHIIILFHNVSTLKNIKVAKL